MFRNRITTMMNEPEPIRLPQPPVPFNPGGFILIAVPVMCVQQWTMQQYVYQRAFELAQAVVRPSLLERDLLGVWN
jgi:hypothetical protein